MMRLPTHRSRVDKVARSLPPVESGEVLSAHGHSPRAVLAADSTTGFAPNLRFISRHGAFHAPRAHTVSGEVKWFGGRNSWPGRPRITHRGRFCHVRADMS
jgi:hypothetical protein